MITVPTGIFIALIAYFVYQWLLPRLVILFWKDEVPEPDGFIYLLERADGIYKIGKTKDLERRYSALYNDYGLPFLFSYLWSVFSIEAFEEKALEISKQHEFPEEGRQELRQMAFWDWQLFVFKFSLLVRASKIRYGALWSFVRYRKWIRASGPPLRKWLYEDLGREK